MRSRRNPLSSFASLAFSKQNPEYLQEMRGSRYPYDFEAAAIALAEWSGRGHEEMRSFGLQTIANHVSTNFKDSMKAMEWIGKMNRRLAVWCACACAREALFLIPKKEQRPRLGLEIAEQWVRGKVDKSVVYEAREEASKASHSLLEKGTFEQGCAATAISDGVLEAIYRRNAGEYASQAPAYMRDALGKLTDISVIADAILTFPPKST